jgi:hypothetical protein
MFVSKTSKQLSQSIDAESVFTALEQATLEAKNYRGSLFWREVNATKYLIRAVTADSQKSLGPLNSENAGAVAKFQQRKEAVESRVKSLKAELMTHQKVNKAQRVGRAPDILISTLNAIREADLEDHFLVVGTHALYAYETMAGVMFPDNAMATQDIDLLFDTRKRLKFFTQIKRLDKSFLQVLQKADKTFRIREDQLYTAVNDKGFEVDVVRRMVKDTEDPHPLRLSDDEDDFWAVQISMGSKLLGARPFKQIVTSSLGNMARMNTVHPLDFARLKHQLGKQIGRDPQKAGKDLLQAKLVENLVEDHLPHLGKESAQE